MGLVTAGDGRRRCGWSSSDQLYMEYHDTEWGVPVHDDRKQFAFLILESFQAGLSWITILRKRRNFEKAFMNFDPSKIASYGERDIERLMKDEGIIRNRRKIEAAICNANAFLKLQCESVNFDDYLWDFVGGKPIRNSWSKLGQIPARTRESENMSKGLISKGFRFVGPTICYAHMQATGMVNDHLVECFRYSECNKMHRRH